jgi:hypothetical protein
MTTAEDALVYLNSAGKDLIALRNMLDEEKFPLEVYGFHAQQSIHFLSASLW